MDEIVRFIGGLINTHGELEMRLEDTNAKPMSLPLEFLKEITDDFSIESVLGHGGFGVVYKGVLQSGKIIAVKKLLLTNLNDQMFQNEVGYLMGMKHQNIVKLVGYCAESICEMIEMPSGSGRYVLAEMPKRLLCFEYVSNQSLDKHFSDESSGLEWNMRYQIIKGICDGLHFLHEECHIVHMDLKPQNILMDSVMTPKIADFGLSRIFGEQQSRTLTSNFAGTPGFMAPEYITRGVISNKADIFSLGVIVIEIITGHRNYPDNHYNIATSLEQYTEEVIGSWRKKFLSRKYKCMETYAQQVRQCITIALKCVDPNMDKRPTIKDIIQILNDVDQQEIPQFIQNIPRKSCGHSMISLDVSQTKPWILLGHDSGYIDIFGYDKQKSIGSDTGDGEQVRIIKFLERKKWFIVGSITGVITVYTYETKVQKIISFVAKGGPLACIDSLAVHPTQSYLLSSSFGYIQLWDWDRNWLCIQRFERPSLIAEQRELAFNPINPDEFASSENEKIKIWNTGSLKRNYTLRGHSEDVNSLEFFTHDDNKQYLITGSSDNTVKIWDMQQRACVHTLEGFMSPLIFVGSYPRLSVLITCTKDGAVHLWSATNFRLMRTLKIGRPGGSYGLARLTGSGRVVMGNESRLFMIDILDE